MENDGEGNREVWRMMKRGNREVWKMMERGNRGMENDGEGR